MLGIVVVTTFETETVASVKSKDVISAGGFTLRHEGYTTTTGPNYSERSAQLTVILDGKVVGIASPSKRFYPARQMPTSEASIHTFGFSQLYLSLGDVEPDGSVTLRVWWKPMVILIWLGVIFMCLAGVVSLTDRKLRIGAPAKSRKKTSKATVHA